MDDITEVDGPFARLKPNETVPETAPGFEGDVVLPVPANAPPMPQTHFKLGQPSARWAYRDTTGATMFEVLRFNKHDGGKIFLPLTLWRDVNGFRWRWKAVPKPRPLYNLHKLAAQPDETVVVCEGEKSADAAALIFPEVVATTSPGGANAAEKADWSVLRGRKVLIWPDQDTPGHTYAENVGAKLTALDCEVSVIDAAALAQIAPGGGTREPTKTGWDAADALNEWDDVAALRLAAIKSTNATDVVPAYVSFGRFKMDADGLHTEIKQGRGENP
ncbi:MAG: DUF6371 domain-containing protein [Hyphomicrobiales bacterium]